MLGPMFFRRTLAARSAWSSSESAAPSNGKNDGLVRRANEDHIGLTRLPSTLIMVAVREETLVGFGCLRGESLSRLPGAYWIVPSMAPHVVATRIRLLTRFMPVNSPQAPTPATAFLGSRMRLKRRRPTLLPYRPSRLHGKRMLACRKWAGCCKAGHPGPSGNVRNGPAFAS